MHEKLHIQARNLLLEYRMAHENRGWVPAEVVERLMQLYGELMAREIWGSLQIPPPIREGDIIAFVAWQGHPTMGQKAEFVGRVERDAKGLHAANYYDWAWKEPRILERAPAPDLKKIPVS